MKVRKKKKGIYLKLTFFFLFFLQTTESYAYLDPGTGSVILQAIIAFVAGTITVITVYWAKLKQSIIKIFSKLKKK